MHCALCALFSQHRCSCSVHPVLQKAPQLQHCLPSAHYQCIN
uniref:Uncharacterized protein n=1 Tax=Anguilla anguilla TaxID=7936 RepID=A0A0E9S9U1_ANGAN